MYLGIVDILSEMIQDHHLNTLINFSTLIFASQLSTNNNNIQQASDIQIKPWQSTSPCIYNLIQYSSRLWSLIRAFYKPKTLFLTIYPPPIMSDDDFSAFMPCLIYIIKDLKPWIIHLIKDVTKNTKYWRNPLPTNWSSFKTHMIKYLNIKKKNWSNREKTNMNKLIISTQNKKQCASQRIKSSKRRNKSFS